MTVYVVTASEPVRDAFRSLERSRSVAVVFVPVDGFEEIVRQLRPPDSSFVYLDVYGLDAAALRRKVRALARRIPSRFGIIDACNEVLDVAELFHLGAVDYLGRELLGRRLPVARLRRFVPDRPAPRHGPGRPSGAGWECVADGGEYTFLMVYAGIDRAGELRRKASEASIRALRGRFQQLLERTFAGFQARVWMWKEDDGLILMPFDGRSVGAVIPALRLMLNRLIVTTEELGQVDGLTWRLAMHVGGTTYRTSGRTGAIVSESVNFMFHLGHRFLDQETLALTAPVYALTPQPVRGCFVLRGSYEAVDVYALRPRQRDWSG